MNSDKIVNISPTYRVWCCLWVGQQFIETTVLCLVVISGTSAQAFGEVWELPTGTKSGMCNERCQSFKGSESAKSGVVNSICYCNFY